jgi:hypothetical protein
LDAHAQSGEGHGETTPVKIEVQVFPPSVQLVTGTATAVLK